MTKPTTIQFRCSAAMKERLQSLRSRHGAKSLSQLVRGTLEAAIDFHGGAAPWPDVTALKESSVHLNRIATALRRCALEGSRPGEILEELDGVLAKVYAQLDAGGAQRSKPGRDRRR